MRNFEYLTLLVKKNGQVSKKESFNQEIDALALQALFPSEDATHISYFDTKRILGKLGWQLVTEQDGAFLVATFVREVPGSTLDLMSLLLELIEVGPAPDHEQKLRNLVMIGMLKEDDFYYLRERLLKKLKKA